ncbi:MAG: hypothetical protein LW629_06575 [Burkholderiales bacterium]|nr:hypothetical protein [Burkholderiales bacterium]
MIKQTMAGIISWAINTLKETVAATDVQQRLERTVAFKVFNQFIGLSIPFVSRNGFKVVDVAPGYVKALVPLQGNQNHMKTMYAGAMFLCDVQVRSHRGIPVASRRNKALEA